MANLQHLAPTFDQPIQEWWTEAAAAIPFPGKRSFNTAVTVGLWQIWLERNSRVFEKVSHLPHIVVRNIAEELRLITLAGRGGREQGIT